MGIIIAKFRKKTSTYDILSKLEDEISSIEQFQQRTKQTQRKIVFRFIFLAILIYVLSALVLYLYFSEITQYQKFFLSIPLIMFPLLIWSIKKFLTWYYNRKIKKNEKKLVTLKERKKTILENVMETETYKVAKAILDKFAIEPKKPVISTPTQKPAALFTPTAGNDSVLRQRVIASRAPSMGNRISLGVAPNSSLNLQKQMALATPGVRRSLNILSTPGAMLTTPLAPSLPRRILPQDRTVLDKMVDYLVGDGPSNRYALICQNCSCHNGMALKEEFEYLSFYCCYCTHFNPARKKKPVGPKFESPLTPAKAIMQGESSDSERNSEDDSDAESRPLIEEMRSDSPDVKTSEHEKTSDTEDRGSEFKTDADENKTHEDTNKIDECRDTVNTSSLSEK